MTELRYGYFPWNTSKRILRDNLKNQTDIHRPAIQYAVAVTRIDEVLTLARNGGHGKVELFDRIVPDVSTKQPRHLLLTVDLNSAEVDWLKGWAKNLLNVDLDGSSQERVPLLLDIMVRTQ